MVGTGLASIVPLCGMIALFATMPFAGSSSNGEPRSAFTHPIYLTGVIIAFGWFVAAMTYSILAGKGTHTKRALVKCNDGSIRLRERPHLFWKQLGSRFTVIFEGIAVDYQEPNYHVSLKYGNYDTLLMLVTAKEPEYKKYLKKLVKFTGFEVGR